MHQLPDPRIMRLVQSCAGLTPEERQDHLARECGGDEELLRSVEAMIAEEPESVKTQLFSNDYEKALPEHYRLIRMVGRGGMAEVFLAEDRRLSRRVAIKFLNSEFRKDPDRMRRFNREARAASGLNHPNILIIHDIGENEGVQFIVSEFVEGETLNSRISRGKIPLPEAVDIAIQIASALVASHKAGIVHRDIKPDNVMIRADGAVKVLDFGLAKETGNNFGGTVDLDANTIDKVLTSPGLILGTPQYMSPEQVRGLALDTRTDIFSLGIILFEMVTGQPPFDGKSMPDIMAAILGKEPPRLEELLVDPPLTLIRIVQKALRKDSEERYGMMDHLLSDLNDLKHELVTETFKGRETGGTQARTTRHNTVRNLLTARFLHWDMLLLLIAIPAVAFAAWWYSSGQRQEERSVQGSMRTVPITSWSSSAGEPTAAAASFSPDAKMIAFAATKSGATEIWVKQTSGGEPVQVTKNGFYNQYPVWSPNGQDIAFFSSRGGSRGIWRAAFTGGEQFQVSTGVGPTARPLLWSSNRKIYFQDGHEVFAVDERSGEKTRVTDFGSKDLKPRAIELSEDGSMAAYSIKENDMWKVKVARPDAEAPSEIGSFKDQIDHIAWHPNGKSVIFSSSADGTYQVFEAGIEKGGPVQLSNGNLDFFVQDVSRDGSQILYGSVNETSDLWLVNTETTEQSLVANDVASEYWADISPDGKSIGYQSVKQVDRPFGGSINIKSQSGSGAPLIASASGFSPVWARDGKWVAFFKRSEAGIGIWRARPTGDEALQLASGDIKPPGYTATPYLKSGTNHISWSPDSGSIAYTARADGIFNIWLAAADGSRNEPLTRNKDAAEVFCCTSWTPDGRYLVFSSESTVTGIPGQTVHRLWLFHLENLEQELIFESKEPVRLLGLGHDRNNVVFAQKASSAEMSSTLVSADVVLLSINTGTNTKVGTISNVYFHNIHLSQDGRSIAFVSRREGETALWTVAVPSGTPRKLLAENDPKIMVSSLAWSPDGRAIVFSRQTRTNLLSMLSK